MTLIEQFIKKRKQWYLDNYYVEYKKINDMPPYIKLRLDTDLRRDILIIKWMINEGYAKTND